MYGMWLNIHAREIFSLGECWSKTNIVSTHLLLDDTHMDEHLLWEN